MASLALMGYNKTVEIQRYRTHKRNLLLLKGKLQEYYYEKKYYLDGSHNLADLNSILGTHIEDPYFLYSYNNPTPDTFHITTTCGTINYTCTIEQDESYPTCIGAVPE